MRPIRNRYTILLLLKQGIIFVSVLYCLGTTAVYGARSVTFSWTPTGDEPPVDGYKLYYKIGDPPSESDFAIAKASYDGTDVSGGNSSPIVIPGATASQYFLGNIYEGKKYTFVLTAYRDAVESDPSGPIILEAIPESIAPDLLRVDEVK